MILMPVIRNTSRQAYCEVMASGYLGATLRRIYRSLYMNPRSTPNECCAWIETQLGRRINKPSYTPRFAVLERAKLVRDLGTRTCRISGKECHVYEITNTVPTEKVKDERPPKQKAYRVSTEKSVKWYSEDALASAKAYYEMLVDQDEPAELVMFVEKKVIASTF